MSNPADRLSPMSGKVYGPDGKVYWLTDLLQGAGGGATMQFLHGTNDPTSDLGRDGDVYLNTSSGDLFKREDGDWVLLMNLVGPQGPQGQQGSQGEQGPPGRGIADITYDADTNEIVFAMTDGAEIRLPWPSV